MKTQEIFDTQAAQIIEKIQSIDGRVFARYDNGFLVGSFRGKDSYRYSLSSRQFVFNKGGRNVSDVIRKAVDEFDNI